MARVNEWTDEEVNRLTELYTSNRSFDEIMLEFPSRTSNAVRLKASRLGLRRPNILLGLIQSNKMRFQSQKDEFIGGYLIKCDDCGSWIQVESIDIGIYKTVRCLTCGSIHEIFNDS
jgi:predicted Zn finger-like uncharacterized protein